MEAASGRLEDDQGGLAEQHPVFTDPPDPKKARELFANPIGRALRQQIEATRADAAEVRRLTADTEQTQSSGRRVGDGFAYLAYSGRGNFAMLAARYPDVPAIRQLGDMLASAPGEGRVVGQTFERAHQQVTSMRANELKRILGDSNEPDAAREKVVGDILAGRQRTTTDLETARQVQGVRDLLNRHLAYLRKAGLEVGQQRDYFPRVVDDAKVWADPDGFKDAATKLYTEMGVENPAEAAQAWHDRIRYGTDLGATEYDVSPSLPFSRATKGRTLPKAADTIMGGFYADDLRGVLANYFRSTSKRAEFARRFGPDGGKADAMFAQIAKAGVPHAEIALLRDKFDNLTGRMQGTGPASPAGYLSSWAQTWGVLTLLPRSVIPSIVEPLGAGIRMHGVDKGFAVMRDTFRALLHTDHSIEQTREAAEAMGIIGDAMTQMVLSAKYGLDRSKLQSALVYRMFKTNGLHQLTEAQRTATTGVGQRWIAKLVNEAATGAKTAASAQRLLNELGIDAGTAGRVHAWFGENGGTPKVAELVGDRPEAKAYRTAIQRLVDETIQNPESMDKPILADRPGSRLIYGIMSFNYAYTRNVILRTAKETGRAFGGNMAFGDRVRLLSVIPAYATLAAAQMGLRDVRDQLFNAQGYDRRSKEQQQLVDLSAAGAFGAADPIVTMIGNALIAADQQGQPGAMRYNADFSQLAQGPYVSNFAQGLNAIFKGLVGGSSRTNTAEWTGTRAALANISAPAITAGLSLLPSGGLLAPVKGLVMLGATSPGALNAAADEAAGDRTPSVHPIRPVRPVKPARPAGTTRH